ncbi:FMN-binding protein [Ruminococcus sp. 1001136sp1]|uniref:FMN-binding protein n=1 Tax=unclassified Ruminococcus TaxID=2608920 RepID=UPI00189E1CC6|nr:MULTISPECIES: FMN-binding protein [unclassified Ruminococcus]MDB8772083.1 FMN-binding protein [Ruminococcus sp. 1001136sp1]MDB8782663.1 FMN-binding protein [Ruminococcus sp. 1001136sp1]
MNRKNFLKNKKINWIKVVIQILSFALIPGLFEGEFAAVGNIVSCIYKGNISWESVKYSVWMLLATVPATVLVGRFFCGFFCSFGAVQDLLWLGSHRLRALFPGKRNLKKADRIFRFAKYAVLFYFIIFIWSGVTAVKTAGPWQVFGQYVSFGHWPGLKPLLSVGGVLLLLIFIGSLFVQRFFCRYFCPMGAIYSLISQTSFLKIDKPREECGKCHLCTSKCTMGMDLTKKDRIAGGECISCQKCVSWCPKGNAHFRSRYGVLIGVGVTCATIMVSQLLIAGNLAKEKTADSVKKTAENDAGGNFQNGIYTGTGEGYRGKVTVTVKVADGKITELVLDDYADGKSYMERAKNRIFQEMISRQNTDVDAVSGATYSSNGLIEAVNKALGNDEGEGKKPEQEESEDKQSFIEAGRFQNLTDGIYTGSADAFRGDVEVQVTVEKQKVTDISILSYCDTEEYFFRAAPAVIEQMKAEQSLNVDAVSGATYSSNGVIHAVANALEIPEDQYAPRPGRNLTAKKKNHGHIVKHEITSQEEYEEKVEKYSK